MDTTSSCKLFQPNILLNLMRGDYIDNSFYGFLAHYKYSDSINLIQSAGENFNYPFFLRSLAKPIQTSLMIDFKTNEFFKFTNEEIAIFSASHTGQNYHIKLVKSILKKIGLNETFLKCGIHPPIVKQNVKHNSEIHNNCSGKHALMLALCVQNGWDTKNYLDFEHPLQTLTLKKIINLSGFKTPPTSLDGCGAPIYAMPLENLAQAFFSLFLNEKYSIIKNSFLNYPEIIGGENRLDTKIMQENKKLIAKVGAGGFLAVLNIEKEDILIIKLCQDNNLQREIIASYALNQLGWIDKNLCEYEAKNLHMAKIGEYIPLFCLNN